MPALIRNARYLKTERDRERRPNVKAIHEYGSDAAIDNTQYRILLVIREHLDGKRFYDHIAIPGKREPAGSGEHQAPKAR
ncbi:MAG: hypothetical protein ACREXR_22010 [Gammaproteobacteria bacterium]